MSTTYAGKFKLINASTNATPIVIQTTTAHGYSTADVVSIAGHLTNTKANGEWTIIVTDATHFSLTGSVGNGVGGATGTVTSFVASVTIPADGDARDAASVNVATEGAADRTQLLYQDFKQRMLGILPLVPYQSITRVQEYPAYAPAANWVPDAGNSRMTNLVVGTSLWIPVVIPHGAIWTGYTISLIGAAGHGAFPGGKPAAMPNSTGLKMHKTTGVESGPTGFTAPMVDASATAGAYEAIHSLTDSGGTEIVDRTLYKYFIQFISETGANGIVGDVFCCASVTYTLPAVDVGAT